MLEDFKPELKKFYGDVDNLPEWVQNQVAVLMLLDPNNKNSDIEGVGRRITKNVFWIYKKGEQLGDDTGSQG
jgi:DNA relaxase NicK